MKKTLVIALVLITILAIITSCKPAGKAITIPNLTYPTSDIRNFPLQFMNSSANSIGYKAIIMVPNTASTGYGPIITDLLNILKQKACKVATDQGKNCVNQQGQVISTPTGGAFLDLSAPRITGRAVGGPDSCDYDDECSAGYVCREYWCVEPTNSPVGGRCVSTPNCQSGLTCVNNVCLVPIGGTCTSSTQCQAGIAVCSNNVCTALASQGESCEYNEECQTGLVCQGYTCVVPPPPPTTLCGNSIINSGEQCDDGNNNRADGCFNCITETDYVTCTDGSWCVEEGDTGENPHVKSRIFNHKFDFNEQMFYDDQQNEMCTSGNQKVSEYYCTPDCGYANRLHDCTCGCEDGACKPDPYCVDSESGSSNTAAALVKGNITGLDASCQPYFINDTCASPTVVREYFCYNFVPNKYSYEDRPCASGYICQDGKCVVGEEEEGNATVNKTGPANAAPNATINYTITIRNTGTTPIINLMLKEIYPSLARYVSATPPPTTPNNTWLFNLSAGQTITITITVQISSTASNGTNITNKVNMTVYGSTQQATHTTRILTTGAVCGNGIREGTEQCDDGNQNNTDACLNNCTNNMALLPLYYCEARLVAWPGHYEYARWLSTNSSCPHPSSNVPYTNLGQLGFILKYNITSTTHVMVDYNNAQQVYQLFPHSRIGANLGSPINWVIKKIGYAYYNPQPNTTLLNICSKYVRQPDQYGGLTIYLYEMTFGSCSAGFTLQTRGFIYPVPCSDTDGGIKKYVSGTVTRGSTSNTDQCYGTSLREYYCGNNAISYVDIQCENGCNSSNRACNIPPVPSITTAKTSSPDPVQANGIITYTITISNTGSTSLGSVILEETYPSQVQYINATLQPTSGNNRWNFTLSGGQTQTITINARVNANVTNGAVLNNIARLLVWDYYTYNMSETTTVQSSQQPPAVVCGNNIRQGSEQCDGTDSAACPGQCRANCTCPPTAPPPPAENITYIPPTVTTTIPMLNQTTSLERSFITLGICAGINTDNVLLTSPNNQYGIASDCLAVEPGEAIIKFGLNPQTQTPHLVIAGGDMATLRYAVNYVLTNITKWSAEGTKLYITHDNVLTTVGRYSSGQWKYNMEYTLGPGLHFVGAPFTLANENIASITGISNSFDGIFAYDPALNRTEKFKAWHRGVPSSFNDLTKFGEKLQGYYIKVDQQTSMMIRDATKGTVTRNVPAAGWIAYTPYAKQKSLQNAFATVSDYPGVINGSIWCYRNGNFVQVAKTPSPKIKVGESCWINLIRGTTLK